MRAGTNWTPLLIEAIARQGSFWSVLFFLSFVMICHVLVLHALLVALMLEVYSTEMEKAARASSEDKMSILLGHLAPPPPAQVDVQVVLLGEVRERFQKYDVDCSGALSKEEVRKLVADLGGDDWLSDADLQTAMEEMDLDASGLIELEEFL